ncbi:MAG: TlpA disulfide reductase family protein [Verrucomicrobiota bacterium]
MKTHIKLAAILLALTTYGSTRLTAEETPAAKSAAAAPTLKMGDAAPELKVTEWFKGTPVTSLDASKTYIVECWATWCGPCIAAFPHLSELAKANEGKITVIGVNVWEKKKPDEVKAFVEAQGDKMSYNVVADGEGAIANNWLKAAGRNGIPCAFVVNKGKVAWIGHPAALDQPMLTSIIDGTFDVAAFAKAEEKQQAAGKYFGEHVAPLLREKNNAGAIEALEKMKKEFPGEEKTINGHIERLKAQQPKG